MNKEKKKILVLDAHPYSESYCSAIAQEYFNGAKEQGFEVKIVKIRELNFDPILHCGYSKIMELEPDLQEQQELIKWSDHLLLVTPLWWLNIPSLLKGYIDRVFLPGFSFKYSETSPMPEKLLKGRSASVIYTQGSPEFYTKFILQDIFWKCLNKGILSFCGYSNVRRMVFDNMPKRNEKELKNFLKKVYAKGKEGF